MTKNDIRNGLMDYIEEAVSDIAIDLDYNEFTTEGHWSNDIYRVRVKLKDGTFFDVVFPAEMVERYQMVLWGPDA